MLRHPFFGIVIPKADDAVHREALQGAAAATGRRTFFGQIAALAAGTVALVFGRSGSGQELRSDEAVRAPNAGRTGQSASGGGQYTTQALGEEGSGDQRPMPPTYPPAGTVTTYAVGEEAGWQPRPPYPSYPPPGTVTTYAVGEEAGYGWGGYYYRPRRYIYRPRYYYYRY